MLLTIPITEGISKCGPTMGSETLRLTACGVTEEDARMKLEQGIAAWCNALQRVGQFKDALKRAHLYLENNGAEDLKIVTVVEKGF